MNYDFHDSLMYTLRLATVGVCSRCDLSPVGVVRRAWSGVGCLHHHCTLMPTFRRRDTLYIPLSGFIYPSGPQAKGMQGE